MSAPTRPHDGPPAPGDRWQPRFFAIFTGQALSLIGSAMTQFVLLWWITQETGSAAALGTAGVAALLPQALLGPLGGTLADRFSRRVIMVVTDAVSALCMLVLVALFASGGVELWHVYTMMFVRSSMQAFQAPAAAASTAMLVPPDWVPRAAGLNQTLQGLMTVAAAPLGALALAALPLQGALMIDVVTALLGITPLLFLRVPQGRAPEGERGGVLGEFLDGLRYVWSRPGLRALYGLLGAVVLVVMPTFTLTPLLVKEHFGGGAGQVALMEGLSGVGMILGGLLVAAVTLRRRLPVVLIALAASCATVALTALAPREAFWLAVAWWTLSGAAFAMGNAPFTAILQTVVPNHLQGRVLSLLSTVMGLAGPVGLAIAAPLGEVVGVRGLFVIGGGLSALVCLLGFLSPALRRVEETAGEGGGEAGGQKGGDVPQTVTTPSPIQPGDAR